jgi:hypothetical protein
MKIRLLITVAALALAAGCSSSSDATSDTDEGAVETDRSLKGAFSVNLDGHEVKFDYTLSNIDLRARTVTWNTKITDKGGHSNVWDDEDVRGTITAVARCPGCFTAEMPGSNPFPLAIVSVDSWEVTSIKYENVTAQLSATSGGASDGDSQSASDVGSCTQTCSGSSRCEPNVRRSQCASGTGLFPVMRCPTTYTFDEGKDCP